MIVPDRIKSCNLILLGGEDGKRPIEKGWQKKTRRINDPKLKEHLKAKKNYGVRCGSSSPIMLDGETFPLVAVDFDNEEIQKELLPKLPKTFSVKTGGKDYYIYILLAIMINHLRFSTRKWTPYLMFKEKVNKLLVQVVLIQKRKEATM